MSRIGVKERFGKEIQDLFECNRPKDRTGILDRGFMIEKTIGTKSVLFIGMNPSFNEKKDQANTETFGKVSYFDDYSHKYFAQMVKIASACGMGIAHHDLYFVRETSQNKVVDLYAEHSLFFQRQIEISNKIITAANPIAMVIANAAVSELFFERQKRFFHFDNQIGTYVLNAPSLESVPVFCSSMLSGKRALDRFSRQRFVWQIQRALQLRINDTTLDNTVDWRTLMF